MNLTPFDTKIGGVGSQNVKIKNYLPFILVSSFGIRKLQSIQSKLFSERYILVPVAII